MVNLTKLKNSDKNITRSLVHLYKDREHALKVVDRISKKITNLENSKRNCKERIKEERAKQKGNKK